MPFTEAARNIFLNKSFRFTGSEHINLVSLHTGDPGTTGANEVVGTGYARKSIGLSTATGSSTVVVALTGSPAQDTFGLVQYRLRRRSLTATG